MATTSNDIRFYGTKVTVLKRQHSIEESLYKLRDTGGVLNIHKHIGTDGTEALGFTLSHPTIGRLQFVLRPDVETVYQMLLKSKKYRSTPDKQQLQLLREQAARTAWALLEQWTSCQVDLIRVGLLSSLQAFMHALYMPDRDQTLGQMFEDPETANRLLGVGTPQA